MAGWVVGVGIAGVTSEISSSGVSRELPVSIVGAGYTSVSSRAVGRGRLSLADRRRGISKLG